MKRSKPLRRGRGLRRSSRLAPVSDRRAAEQDEREQVREFVLAAHGYRCALAAHGDCRDEFGGRWRLGDRLDTHEVVRRSQLPHAHLLVLVCLPLCRGHHDLDLVLPVAERVGIRAPRWAIDRYGLERVVEELARVRSAWCSGREVVPFWRADEPVWSAET